MRYVGWFLCGGLVMVVVIAISMIVGLVVLAVYEDKDRDLMVGGGLLFLAASMLIGFGFKVSEDREHRRRDEYIAIRDRLQKAGLSQELAEQEAKRMTGYVSVRY